MKFISMHDRMNQVWLALAILGSQVNNCFSVREIILFLSMLVTQNIF